jgi:AcrR family transcriptional regulator
MIENKTTGRTGAREPTRARILRAAERLFAVHGIDGVSLRAINAEARTNVASANYHFGTKDDIVRAILADRMPAIERQRRTLLAEIDAKHPSVKGIVRALVVPLAAVAESGPDGRAYVGFLARLRVHSDPELVSVVTRELAPSTRNLMNLLSACVPEIPRERLRVRWLLVVDLVLYALAEPERFDARSGIGFVDELAAMAAAALAAPP